MQADWRLSNTLTAGFRVEALSEALGRFGKPGIFNTDQAAQFASDEFTQILRLGRLRRMIEKSRDGVLARAGYAADLFGSCCRT